MTREQLKERLYNGECLNDLLEFTPGQECDIYKAKEWNPGDEVIYIPDIYLNEIPINRPLINSPTRNEINEVISNCYTGRDFMELCDNNEELAKDLFDYVDWQHPSSALDEVLEDYENQKELDSHYGEIEFNNNNFIVKERDECSNPEWMYLCDLFGLDYDVTERIVINGIVKYFGLRKDEM